MPLTPQPDARRAGAFSLAGVSVARLGYGSAKLTGPGIWGYPPDLAQAIAVLQRAVELGVELIDTADSYGPFVAEELVRRALHPYDGLTVATKGGCLHPGPDRWTALGDPEFLRQSCEMSLRRLGIEAIDIYQLHEVDPRLPFEEQLGVLIELQREGKIRQIGLSSVTVAQVETAVSMTQIVTVQGELNVMDRSGERVMRACEERGIGFIPFFPLADGAIARRDGPLAESSRIAHCTPAQLALAWLLDLSPCVIPIPGTPLIAELEENLGSGEVTLDDSLRKQLDRLARPRHFQSTQPQDALGPQRSRLST